MLGQPQRPAPSSPACSPTFSALKTFCRLPGATQGGSPAVRVQPRCVVYTARRPHQVLPLETHADFEADGRTARSNGLGAQWRSFRRRRRLTRLGRYPLLVIDEVGYIPLESESAYLFFQLVGSRYERASLIVPVQPSPGGPGPPSLTRRPARAGGTPARVPAPS